MRVKELADLTGVTVRTIRYYHQISLLPVPEERYGRRDYDLAHVARLVRIRWLTLAGVPLAGVAGMLGDPTPPSAAEELRRDAVLTDLRAGVAALDEQLRELRTQRERMSRLIAGVERDGHLSPMPAAMLRFYQAMQERATDERTRRVIREERDFLELAFYRGDMPPESAVVYEKLAGAAALADSFAMFRQIADRAGRAGALDDREIDRTANAVVDRLTRQLGADFSQVLGLLDLDLARRAADLYVRLADPRERRVARAIGDAILTAIEKSRHE
jgi:DNA-binding transcriptional MerR regulator